LTIPAFYDNIRAVNILSFILNTILVPNQSNQSVAVAFFESCRHADTLYLDNKAEYYKLLVKPGEISYRGHWGSWDDYTVNLQQLFGIFYIGATRSDISLMLEEVKVDKPSRYRLYYKVLVLPDDALSIVSIGRHEFLQIVAT
jgi:hypothetical protein